MQSLADILGNTKVVAEDKPKKYRPINETWELADEFGKYVGMSTTAVLRLFKLYGKGNVLAIKSWLYDVPYDKSKGGKIALAHWKLKTEREAKAQLVEKQG